MPPQMPIEPSIENAAVATSGVPLQNMAHLTGCWMGVLGWSVEHREAGRKAAPVVDRR